MTSTDVFPGLDPPSDVPVRASSRRRRRPPRDRKTTNDSSQPSRNPTYQEDRRLIDLLLKRDPAAWTEFVHRYERLIVSRVWSTCRETGTKPRPDLVEDCGAEVMAALFHGDMAGLRRFQGRSKLSTWLAVITRRTTLGILRRRRHDADVAMQPDGRIDLEMIPDTRVGGLSLVDADDHARLQACLQKLSEGDRHVLSLQFEHRLSYAEIARILGISKNAIGPKLHRAQERLKKLMKQV